MTDEAIEARVKEMRKAVGHTMETMALGYMISALGLRPENAHPIVAANPEKYDNGGLSKDAAHQMHLEYLRDMFGLDDLAHAQAFSDYTEGKLLDMYRKMAQAERDFGGGEQVPAAEMRSKLYETIDREAAKERAQVRQ